MRLAGGNGLQSLGLDLVGGRDGVGRPRRCQTYMRVSCRDGSVLYSDGIHCNRLGVRRGIRSKSEGTERNRMRYKSTNSSNSNWFARSISWKSKKLSPLYWFWFLIREDFYWRWLTRRPSLWHNVRWGPAGASHCLLGSRVGVCKLCPTSQIPFVACLCK